MLHMTQVWIPIVGWIAGTTVSIIASEYIYAYHWHWNLLISITDKKASEALKKWREARKTLDTLNKDLEGARALKDTVSKSETGITGLGTQIEDAIIALETMDGRSLYYDELAHC